MRILLDNGIFAHSDFGSPAVLQTSGRWGKFQLTLPVQGFVRKAPDKNPEYEKQKEALFTVGRLIREGRLEAHEYNEVLFERMRGRIGMKVCNALQDCQIHECPPAVERSKFRMTVDFKDMVSKGGKKDRKAGLALGSANQIAFLEWLCSFRKEHVEALIAVAAQIHLTEFEIESLKNIGWFQLLCQRSGSPENYPDVFHLWTAERHGLDALLTLDNGLPNLVAGVRNEKAKKIEVRTDVLRPLDLLCKLGIEKPDAVPMEPGRFYYLHELFK